MKRDWVIGAFMKALDYEPLKGYRREIFDAIEMYTSILVGEFSNSNLTKLASLQLRGFTDEEIAIELGVSVDDTVSLKRINEELLSTCIISALCDYAWLLNDYDLFSNDEMVDEELVADIEYQRVIKFLEKYRGGYELERRKTVDMSALPLFEKILGMEAS